MSTLLGPPPSVVWLRVRDGSTGAIERLLLDRADEIDRFHGSGSVAVSEWFD